MVEKKKPIHYVNNKDFYKAMVEYKAMCVKAEEEGNQQPRIPNYIGTCIYDIANKLSNHKSFGLYSYKDEMISDGIETCIANIKSFNPEKYDNPFAYFTQICWHSFVQRIQKEKKQQYIKYKSLENAILSNDQHVFQDSDDRNISGSGYNEAAIHVIGSYEASVQKKKDDNKQKKALEKFMKIEESDV